MGIAERKERERQDMMDRILHAAMDLYLENGASNVSIRKIADRIEYSPATIYLYFRNRDEIFLGLHNMAFRKFYDTLRPLSTVKNPLKRLRKSSETYITFAVDNPELYDLMFIMTAPTRSEQQQEVPPMAHNSYNLLRDMVRECIDRGMLHKGDPDVLALTFWTHVHGIASLLIRNRLRIFPENARPPLIKKSLDLMIKHFSAV